MRGIKKENAAKMDTLTPYDFMNPPSSNRGVERTIKNGLIACVDWLSITFPTCYFLQDIMDCIGSYLGDVRYINIHGKYGYKSCLWSNGIFIFYDGHDDKMGTHLQITGEGMRYLETSKKFNIVDFFEQLSKLDESYNITRIDLAIDDLKGYFKIPQIIKKAENAEISSRFKTASLIQKIQLSDGSNKGNTIYFGSPSGNIQIRMYEKNHEMTAKGIEHNITIWNRTELQLRRTNAHNAFEIIRKKEYDLMNTITGILNNYLRVLTKNKNDTNKRRWTTWRNWERFINNINKIKLTNHIIEKDLMHTYLWLRKQVSVSLAKIDIAGIDVFDLIKEGKEKMTEKQLIEVYNYIKKTQKSKSGQFENI